MSMRPAPSMGALVLCGGRARRMGRDKAWLPIGDETALQRISRSLRAEGLPVVMVARPGQTLPIEPDPGPPALRLWRDPVGDGGPLAALEAALAGAGREFDLVFVTAVDALALDPRDATDLLSRLGKSDRDGVVVVDGDGRRQPLLAAYRVAAALAAGRASLRAGERSLRSMTARLRLDAVAVDQLRGPMAVAPCNTPAQWRSLTERLLVTRD